MDTMTIGLIIGTLATALVIVSAIVLLDRRASKAERIRQELYEADRDIQSVFEKARNKMDAAARGVQQTGLNDLPPNWRDYLK